MREPRRFAGCSSRVSARSGLTLAVSLFVVSATTRSDVHKLYSVYVV